MTLRGESFGDFGDKNFDSDTSENFRKFKTRKFHRIFELQKVKSQLAGKEDRWLKELIEKAILTIYDISILPVY